MSNKNNGGWVLNEGLYDRDQDANRRAEVDEKYGLGRLTDDTASIHIKSDLVKLAASDDPQTQAMLREAGIESPLTPKIIFLSDGTKGKVFSDTNGVWHVIVTISGEELEFSDEDRDTVLMSADRYAQKNREPRKLSSTEELRIARLAASGEIVDACGLYVELSLDGQDRRSAEEILTDAKLTPLLNDAARFVWRCSRQDYEPFDEFEALLDRVAETRPLTFRVVDALYDRFLDTEAARAKRRAVQPAAQKSEQIPSQSEVQTELEMLGDAAIDKLRTQTLRERAHEIRRFNERVYGR